MRLLPTPIRPIDFDQAKLMSDTGDKVGDSDLETSVDRLQTNIGGKDVAGNGNKGGCLGDHFPPAKMRKLGWLFGRPLSPGKDFMDMEMRLWLPEICVCGPKKCDSGCYVEVGGNGPSLFDNLEDISHHTCNIIIH